MFNFPSRCISLLSMHYNSLGAMLLFFFFLLQCKEIFTSLYGPTHRKLVSLMLLQSADYTLICQWEYICPMGFIIQKGKAEWMAALNCIKYSTAFSDNALNHLISCFWANASFLRWFSQECIVPSLCCKQSLSWLTSRWEDGAVSCGASAWLP